MLSNTISIFNEFESKFWTSGCDLLCKCSYSAVTDLLFFSPLAFWLIQFLTCGINLEIVFKENLWCGCFVVIFVWSFYESNYCIKYATTLYLPRMCLSGLNDSVARFFWEKVDKKSHVLVLKSPTKV